MNRDTASDGRWYGKTVLNEANKLRGKNYLQIASLTGPYFFLLFHVPPYW